MRYLARTWTEGDATLAEFPDCPGCQTFADEGEDLAADAAEALQGWLEATMAGGDVPPRPSARLSPRRGKGILPVDVPTRLAVKLSLRWARQARGLTQAQLAALAGVSQPNVAQIENPDSNPTLATLEKVAAALGCRLEIALAPITIRAPARAPAARRARTRRTRRGTARTAVAG